MVIPCYKPYKIGTYPQKKSMVNYQLRLWNCTPWGRQLIKARGFSPNSFQLGEWHTLEIYGNGKLDDRATSKALDVGNTWQRFFWDFRVWTGDVLDPLVASTCQEKRQLRTSIWGKWLHYWQRQVVCLQDFRGVFVEIHRAFPLVWI